MVAVFFLSLFCRCSGAAGLDANAPATAEGGAELAADIKEAEEEIETMQAALNTKKEALRGPCLAISSEA